MMRRAVRVLGVLAALALTVGAVQAPAVARPSDHVTMPGLCNSPFNVASMRGYDISRVESDRILVYDGVQVKLDRQGWRTTHPQDPSWVLWFQSLNWLVPLALEDPKTAIAIFEERDRLLPDPGTSADRQTRKAIGWTQGQFRTRLETATCLYALTGNARLIPIATRLARANSDPWRYPGPPRREVHNHGTMSNIALVQAGRAFDRPEWISLAEKRFARDLPEVFSACGMMWEQSSTYQDHNVSLWDRAARIMHVDLTKPKFALGALVRPDGVLEAIGDGQPRYEMTPNGGSLWCEKAGWAAGTLNDSTHFTLRFGPKVAYHGHRDHGSMTWFAFGTPVLSDRGLYDKRRDARFAFAEGMSGHSVFEPVGFPRYNPDTAGTRVSNREFVVADAADGISRERFVEFGTGTLKVRDRGSGATEWIQHWQLAPGWRPTPTGAVHAERGLTLTLDCPRMKAVKVESFTAWRTAEVAWDLQCRVEADRKRGQARQATTLTVTPAP